MIRLERTNTQPIGLDLGADSVKLLQLESSQDAMSVVAAARQSLCDEHGQSPTDPAELRKAALTAASRMLGNGGFRGRRVVAALPREIVHFKNLRLPMIPAEELPGAVRFEAASIFPFDTEQAHIHYLHAGDVRQGGDTRQEVIVLAARNEDVDRFVEDLAAFGMDVESIDFEPAAVYRCIERFIRRREDEHELFVLLDIGLRRSQLIIGRGRDISFYKPIDIGGRHLNEAVARKLSLSLDEARALRRRLADGSNRAQPISGPDSAPDPAAPLSDQENPDPLGQMQRDPVRQAVTDATRSMIEELGRAVTLCLRYHSVTFRGHRPARVGVVGGEAADPTVCDLLSATLGLPVQPEWALRHLDIARMPPGERRGPLAGWCAALGLGLRRVGTRRAAAAPARINPLPAGSAHVVELPEHGPANSTNPAAGGTAVSTDEYAAKVGGQDRRIEPAAANPEHKEKACA